MLYPRRIVHFGRMWNDWHGINYSVECRLYAVVCMKKDPPTHTPNVNEIYGVAKRMNESEMFKMMMHSNNIS